MAEVGARQDEAQRGATEPSEAEIRGKVVDFLWWMRNEGYAPSTIEARGRKLRGLLKLGADLLDPQSVKEVVASQSSWNINTKKSIADIYTAFLSFLGKAWKPPKYKTVRELPFIPLESEIDALIAACGKRTATFLQLLKETAMRSCEAVSLTWTDVDAERRTIRVVPKKGGNPRILNVSEKLIEMLNALPKNGKRVFGDVNLSCIRSTFSYSRKRAARKLQNTRLSEIHFHTLRYWKATMEYHKTKDTLHVKELLGHKSIENTMFYIQLEKSIFKRDSDEFFCRAVETVGEAKKLIEVGFEYVCTTPDSFMLFRKRK